MNMVKVKREEVLKRIKANRAVHRDAFLRAQKGFRKAVVAELDRSLKDARAGRRFRLMITLPEPEDHTADYDRVVDMLEMSVDEEIMLDSASFNCFVRDQWAWKHAFAMSNSQYFAGKVPAAIKAAGYVVD
jgi:hypothetical protein